MAEEVRISQPASPDELFARLNALGIAFTTIEHAAAFTVEQGNAATGHLPGVHIKNLFLCDAKKAMWLVVAPADRLIDLKRLAPAMGAARLSFGSPERLMRVLGVSPGSVTPFAVINDQAGAVQVFVDAWMMEQPVINAHPLVNTMTTSLSNTDLERFLVATGHRPKRIALDRLATQA